MTDQISFPPLEDLPAGEFAMRRAHLLNEIASELPKARFASGQRAVMVALALAAALTTGLVAGLWSSPANALPAPFQPAQTALSDQYNIDVSPLPDSTQTPVSEQEAQQIALGPHQSMVPGVTATLVDATDAGGDDLDTGGTRTPLISNRTAWLVLIPGQHVPIIYPYGKTGPWSYSATVAVLIDASDGTILIGAALPAN